MQEPSPPLRFAPVGPAEAGQKLLRFLQRRLNLPEALLHRWIRTGQIRLNGRRCKPYEIVSKGDQVRIPPFACKAHDSQGEPPQPPAEMSGGLPRLLAASDGIWAFAKPAGLAVQPGTGITESFSGMLARLYDGHGFKPAPAHRLDRETSGVLLVGATHKAMQTLQGWFRDGSVHKEYLAWVKGSWPFAEDRLLRHYTGGLNRVEARKQPFEDAREALCVVRPVRNAPDAALLHIHLVTGRKRQIRAQLAAEGFPVLGDSRYGARKGSELKLHACRILLPNGEEFSCLPPWTGRFAVTELPEPLKSGVSA